jgi:hypothetical protein
MVTRLWRNILQERRAFGVIFSKCGAPLARYLTRVARVRRDIP